MAQFVKNNINYHGARSKTSVSRGDSRDEKLKKGKKKGYDDENNDRSSWDFKGSRNADSFRNKSEQRSGNDAWDDISSNSSSWNDRYDTKTWDNRGNQDFSHRGQPQNGRRREAKIVWDDMGQELTTHDTQPNVWEERQMKFEENKSLEPSTKEEEERMIREALEMSKLEIQRNDRRRRVEEEYYMQEQMLLNNPTEFEEFKLCEESPGATVAYGSVSEDNWNNKEYATALKSSSSQKVATTSRKKSHDNWDDYDDIKPQKIISTSKSIPPTDYWGDENAIAEEESSISNTAYNHKDYDNLEKHGGAGVDNWDDCDYPKTQKKIFTFKSSSPTEYWDDRNVITEKKSSISKTTSSQKYENNLKKHDGVGTYSKLSENVNQEKCVEQAEKKIYKSTDSVEIERKKSNINKVVNMFGGWGSSTSSDTRTSGVSNATTTNGKSTKESTKNVKFQYETKSIKKTSLEQDKMNFSVSTSKTQFPAVVLDNSLLDKEENVKTKESELEFSDTIETHDIKESGDGTYATSAKEEIVLSANPSKVNINDMKNCVIVDEVNTLSKTEHSGDALLNTITETESLCINEDLLSNKPNNTPLNQVYNMKVDNEFTVHHEDSFPNKEGLRTVPSTANVVVNSNTNFSNFEGENAYSESLTKCDVQERVTNVSLPSDVHIEPPKPVPTFLPNEYIGPPRPAPVFHPNVISEADTSMAAPMPTPPFLPSGAVNVSPFPINPMAGGFVNPNMMPGINPLVMQHMLMLSNPFLAKQLYALEMYYRAMGIPTGPTPMFVPQVPMMPVLSDVSFRNPSNTMFENNYANNTAHIPDPSIGHTTIINPPTYPTNDVLKPHENNSSAPFEVNSGLIPPDMSQDNLKIDEDVDSLLMSFLSKKEEPSHNNDFFISPPVLAPSSTNQISPNLASSVEATFVNHEKPKSDMNYNNTISDSVGYFKDDAHAAALAEPSEIIGWGDLDVKSSSGSNFDNWDERDGWENDNSTTKSMSNPSRYELKNKSVNRQPASQPNFNRFRK